MPPKLKFKAKVDSKAIDAVLRKLKDLRAPLKQKDYIKIGDRVIKVMKSMISGGQSPIRGKGRFPKYKRQDEPDGYPANVKKRFPGKRQRPVNLELSGKFLASLKKFATRAGVTVGFKKGSLSAKKEEGHRKGGRPGKRQPKRPIIPNVPTGELFAASIQDEYLKIANLKVRQIMKRKN